MARPKCQSEELAARRSETLGPNAARRLLQPDKPASTTLEPPDPRHLRSKGASDLRRTGRKPPGGVGAPSATSTTASEWHVAEPVSVVSFELTLVASSAPAEVSKARSRPALAARQLVICPKADVEPYPDLFRSSTPCREAASPSDGDTDGGGAGSPRRPVGA